MKFSFSNSHSKKSLSTVKGGGRILSAALNNAYTRSQRQASKEPRRQVFHKEVTIMKSNLLPRPRTQLIGTRKRHEIPHCHHRHRGKQKDK